MSHTINDKDKAIYFFICNYFYDHNRVPTVRTLIENGFASGTSVAVWNLDRLKKLGLIKQDEKGKAAGYKIIGVEIKLPKAYWDILEAGTPTMVRVHEG